MPRGVRKELGVELEKLIDETFGKFERYLQTPQDAAMYKRKRKEYLDEINAVLREKGGTAAYGRADDGDVGSDD